MDRSQFKIVRSTHTFGIKSPQVLNVDDVVECSHVRSMSVHAACNISRRDPDTLLMWSRSGLDQLVGTTGRLFTALGMHEADDFQTTLDHRPIDISTDL